MLNSGKSLLTSAPSNNSGTVYEQLSSGPYKDMLSPDKPLTAAERDLVVNAGEKMHRRAGVKMHHRGAPSSATANSAFQFD